MPKYFGARSKLANRGISYHVSRIYFPNTRGKSHFALKVALAKPYICRNYRDEPKEGHVKTSPRK